MSNPDQKTDLLIVSDNPYSSGGSNHSEEEEQHHPEEEEKEVLVEEAKESKPAKKPAEPIFVSVIQGTATIDSNLIYSDKSNNEGAAPEDSKNTKDAKNTKSKCCLLI
ncbi:hypothetical protein M9Y10_032781 [Tritrichomonas musculus]|uniref:Uncharacterized protein n=1 Tax=Tritrichomonas musculus TaxID=1915356 RepID=A0ABR2GKX3_9EUKA